jgi:predicted lipoprotein with Yx(FWY)xxD motif
VGAAGQATKRVAKEAENATLGKTVLTTTKGRTLYSLSAESNGKFVCTGGCLSVWHPLLVPAATKPAGPVKLGTVKRPDGRTQVTFKGRPLYSFSGDTKTGDANGEGIKDVGTWHAAATDKPAAPQAPPEPTYPY